MQMGSVIFWLVVSALALVIDIATSSFFFAGMTIGGIAAIGVRFIGGKFIVQLVIFVIVSAAAIAFEYSWIRVRLKKTIPKTLKMEEQYIGRRITLEEDIEERGRIKFEGIYWPVENIGEPLKTGENAQIVGIKGNKLLISK
jgi:membrane protein implicated in regulation of membrane protease activity